MKEKLTLNKLEQHLSKAAWILKGPVDAADFKVYIFPLLFFKRISDVYDEEFNAALQDSDGDKDYASLSELHRFVIPNGCHKRADFVDNLFNIINWDNAAQRLENALKLTK